MAVLKGKTDDDLNKVRHVLEEYESVHPESTATLYRQNAASIRVRIVDDRFTKMAIGARHNDVYDFLEARLDPQLMWELTVLLLLPTSELQQSFANMDFDHPLPSRL